MTRLTRVAPEVPVSNLAEGIDFYGRLGFSVVSQSAEDYAIVERDGIALHLFEDKLHRSAAMGVHLFTPDLAEMYEEFAARGVRFTQKIERKPWGNRDFRVKDGFGNELKFTEPVGDDE